jgi:hypothetical protein
MSDVYVYNNPGNVAFNTYIYAFLRSWHTLDGDHDAWFKIPAYASSASIEPACINAIVETVSVLLLDERGAILKSHSVKLRQPKSIDAATLKSIDAEALDTSKWELQNQKSFPFDEMFADASIRERYSRKFGQGAPGYDRIMDQNYNKVRRTVSPPTRCGSCGRR